MRKKRVYLLHLSPFEKNKLAWIEELIEDGINPLHAIYISSACDTRFTPKDLRNYHNKKATPFFAVLGEIKTAKMPEMAI